MLTERKELLAGTSVGCFGTEMEALSLESCDPIWGRVPVRGVGCWMPADLLVKFFPDDSFANSATRCVPTSLNCVCDLVRID